MQKYDICALGELLIDFTENGISEQGNPILEANPGGAPANVLAMVNKLGYKTAFIGKVGNDNFGRQLRETLNNVGISTQGLVVDDKVNTTLAFVHTLPDGEREFSFYRNPGADMMLKATDVDENIIKSSKVFHFGSLSMTNEEYYNATKKAIKTAKDSGLIISFDPNLRENLWESLEVAKQKIEYGISQCDVLKISDNEILWLTGEDTFDKAIKKLKSQYDIPLIFLSLGKDGSLAYSKSSSAFSPIVDAPTIEKTGAGDTFYGCILSKILENGIKDYTDNELKEMLCFANTGAAIITTRKGALKVMPEKNEIEALLKANNLTE